MNALERRLFNTNDWFARHPIATGAILFTGWIFVSWLS